MRDANARIRDTTDDVDDWSRTTRSADENKMDKAGVAFAKSLKE